MNIPVSFLVVTYNQEKYVEEAVISALNQNYPSLEVIVSDDGSSDGTWGLIKKTVACYRGPHKIKIRRNESNSGLAVNFNNGLRECSGDLIVVQGGDDISRPDRVSQLVRLWALNKYLPDLLYSEVARISAEGALISVDSNNPEIPTVEAIKSKFFIAGGMSAAYSRRLFDKFGPLPDKTKTEDYVLTFRAILMGGIAHHSEALVKYRIHDNSEMGMRRSLSKYAYIIYDAVAQEAESLDRLRSWDISIHNDFIFRWKLIRRYRSASLFRKLLFCDNILILKYVFMAIVFGHLRPIKNYIAIKIFNNDVLIEFRNQNSAHAC